MSALLRPVASPDLSNLTPEEQVALDRARSGRHRRLSAWRSIASSSGSAPISWTSCAQRQATAILAAQCSASSREGTSTSVNPPMASGYGPSGTVPAVATMLAGWFFSPPADTYTPALIASWTTACAALATAGASSSGMWSIAWAPNEIRYCVICDSVVLAACSGRLLTHRRTTRPDPIASPEEISAGRGMLPAGAEPYWMSVSFGRITQNSFPSGSASTVQDSAPGCPMSTRPAPNASRRSISGVPAVKQRPGDGVHDGDEQAHHAEAGPGLEGVGGVVDVGELAPGLGRPELGDRVPPRVRQRLGDRGQDEQDTHHGGDGGGRVPEQGSRGDAEHRQLGDEHPRLADPGRVPAQLAGDAELGVAVRGGCADGGPQGDTEYDGHAERP